MFVSKWDFVLETRSEKTAKVVINRIIKLFGFEPIHCEFSHYAKADFVGYRVHAKFEHDINDWNEFVLTIINLGGNLGGGWYIGGNMFETATATLSKNTAHISCVGLYWASWEINRNE